MSDPGDRDVELARGGAGRNGVSCGADEVARSDSAVARLVDVDAERIVTRTWREVGFELEWADCLALRRRRELCGGDRTGRRVGQRHVLDADPHDRTGIEVH